MRLVSKIFAFAFVGCAVPAQGALYEETTATHLPPGLAGSCMNAAAGDADGDGDLDLALAMEFERKVLLLNDGAGRFSDASAQLPAAIHDSEDVAFADFDGDGDLDLVFVSEDDRTDELYLNDGTGNFSDASERIATNDVTNGLILMDLDADGRMDVLTANIGLERALISDGQGGFRDETEMRWPQQGESRTQALETGDVDGDGDLDVIVANEGQNQLYLNEGGRLVDVTATHLPMDADETRDIRALDVEGDGDVDLLVGNVTFLSQESAQDYLLLNDGSGRFSRAAAEVFPEDARSNFTLKIADLDRDGDLDAIAPSTLFADSEAEVIALARGADGALLVLKGKDFFLDDSDGDGDVDLQIGAGERRVQLVNDGAGLTYPGTEAPWTELVATQDLDIDNDGAPDTELARVGSALLSGSDSNAAALRMRNAEFQLLDLGRDGSIDVLLPVLMQMASVGSYQVLLNDGRGRFNVAAPGNVLPETADGNGFDVEVADFDADGLSDLFLCNRASVGEPSAAVASGGLQRLLRGVED